MSKAQTLLFCRINRSPLIFFKFFLFIFFILVSYIFPIQAHAASVNVTATHESNSIKVDTPIFLPHENTRITGRGEPEAQISISAFLGERQVFSHKATVSRQGAWQITLPPLEVVPDRVEISSEVDLTPLKIIESVAVFGTFALSGAVLIQQLFERLLRFMQLLGLFPKRTSKGFVFDVATKKPIPFALLSVENEKEVGNQIHKIRETVVSTVDGIFRTITLPTGKYRISSAHPQYTFPCTEKRPWYTSPLDFYQGEVIELNKQNRLDVVFIPMKHKSNQGAISLHWFNLKVLGNIINQVLSALALPLGCASLVLALLYPSFLNFALASMYLALGVYEVLKRQQLSRLSGVILAENGIPISDAVVQIIESPVEEVAGVVVSKKSGKFSILLPKGKYHLNVAKIGYVLDRKDVMSFDEIDLTAGAKNVVTRLKKAEVKNSEG